MRFFLKVIRSTFNGPQRAELDSYSQDCFFFFSFFFSPHNCYGFVPVHRETKFFGRRSSFREVDKTLLSEASSGSRIYMYKYTFGGVCTQREQKLKFVKIPTNTANTKKRERRRDGDDSPCRRE